MKSKVSFFAFYIFLFLSFLIVFSAYWVKDTFGQINFDSLLYHISTNLEGTSSNMIKSYFIGPFLKTIICMALIIILINLKYSYKLFFSFKIFKFKKNDIDIFNLLYKAKILISFIILISSTLYVFFIFDAFEYFKNIYTYSTFIDDNYVDPRTTEITFKEKRNLIHIYVESLESTFSSKEYGGAYEYNLIPNLTNYAKKEVSFTNEFGGGFYNSRATGWTIAAMVAQTSGLPLIVTGDGNNYGLSSEFLPVAYSLGEILEKEGYNQTLLIGSNAEFAGRKEYFTQHGNYNIKDYVYALDKELIPRDYYVWWGYEDSVLFNLAKDELKELSNQREPFNLTILTTNTHHIGGYLENDCEIKYDEQLKNVVLCSDKQLYNFVEWIKKQKFYKNTTIVITGDHLSMEPTFFDNIGDYERTNFNLFINSNKEPVNETNRVFNTLDIYPTIISSIGGSIKGNRLGLGTDLYSKAKTLYEKYGKSYVDKEYSYNSKFYNYEILK